MFRFDRDERFAKMVTEGREGYFERCCLFPFDEKLFRQSGMVEMFHRITVNRIIAAEHSEILPGNWY